MKEHVWIDSDGTTWDVELRRVTGDEAARYDSPWLLVVEGEGEERYAVGIGGEDAERFDEWDEEELVRYIDLAMEESGAA